MANMIENLHFLKILDKKNIVRFIFLPLHLMFCSHPMDDDLNLLLIIGDYRTLIMNRPVSRSFQT